MTFSKSTTLLLLTFSQLAFASLIPRQFYGGGGGYYGNGGGGGGGYFGGGGYPYGSGSDHNAGTFFNNRNRHGHTDGAYPAGGFSGVDNNKLQNLNFSKAAIARIAHAALAASAFVFFFPVGGILVRILPGRLAIFAHVLFQFFGYLLFVAATALGIWISIYVQFSNFDLLKMYHPIIGLVVFGLISFQPIGGILHHLGYKRTGGRTFFSHFHIWMGRILITLGMINGGLGLRLAGNATRGEEIAYGVVAGFMWLIYMLVGCCLGHLRRRRPADKEVNGNGVGYTNVNAAPPRRRRTLLRRTVAGAGVGAAAGAIAGEKGHQNGNGNMTRNGERPISDLSTDPHNIPPIPEFTHGSEGDRARTPMSLVTETTEGMRSPISPVHADHSKN